MRRELYSRSAGRGSLDPGELSAAVVGGGIAGFAAACVLAASGHGPHDMPPCSDIEVSRQRRTVWTSPLS